MADLNAIISKNKKNLVRQADGSLTEETDQNLQGLAGQAGLQAPPISPLGATAIGANPDQAKMAGTPQQKNAALSLASQPPTDNLATAAREAQVNTQASASTQAAQQKSGDLAALGGLGDRVSDFINAQRTALQTQATNATGIQLQASTGDNAEFDKVAPADLPTFKQDLEKFQQDPTNLQLLVDAGNLMGGTVINPADVPNLYQNAQSAITNTEQGTVAKSLTVNDLVNNPAFGYSTAQLSSLLNIPPDQIGAMTSDQLQQAVAAVQQQEFSKSSTLTKQQTDQNLGGAERTLAGQQAQEASATGLRSTEADVANLNTQMQAGNQVSFGGKQYDINALLSDQTISGVISDYMTNPQSADSQKLAQTEPQLVAFINKNQSLFTDAVNTLKTQTQTFSDIQDSNKALANVGNVAVDDSIMAAAIPGWGKLSASKFTIDPNSALGYITTSPNGEAITTQVNNLLQIDPTYAAQVAGLSASDIASLGIDKNSPKWTNFVSAAQESKILQNIDPTDSSSVIDAYLGMNATPDMVNSFVTDNKTRNALGVPAGTNGLLANPDGTPASSADILKAMQTATPQPSLQNAVAGNVSQFQQGNLNEPALTGYQGELYSKLGAAAADGKITGDEISSAIGDNLNNDDMTFLLNMSEKPPPGLDPSATASIQKILTDTRTTNSNNILSDLSSKNYSLPDEISKLNDIITGYNNYGPGRTDIQYLDKNVLSSTLTKLAQQYQDQLADAEADRDEADKKRKLRNLYQVGGALNVGGLLESMGSMLGNSDLNKLGNEVNSAEDTAASDINDAVNDVKTVKGLVNVSNPVNAVNTVKKKLSLK